MKVWNDLPENKRPLLLLNVEDMAKLYGVSKITIHRWHKAGLLPKGGEILGRAHWEAIEIARWEGREMTASPSKNPVWGRWWDFAFNEPPAPRCEGARGKSKDKILVS